MRLSILRKFRPRQIFNSLHFRYTKLVSGFCRHDPIELAAFITTRCNLACNTCPFTHESPYSPVRGVSDLSLDLLKKILDRHPGSMVLGIVGGEPLLHADLIPIIREAVRRKLVVNLSTNGTLLDEKIARELLKFPMGFVNISLDAADSEEYLRMRGQPQNVFEKVLDNARSFNALRLKLNPDIQFSLSSVVDSANFHLLPRFAELAVSIGATSAFFQNILPYQCSGLTQKQSSLKDTEENRTKLAQMKFPQGLNVIQPLLTPVDESQCVSCLHPFRILSFDGSGNLSPCCVIPPNPRYGNMADSVDAWKKGKQMHAVRKAMIDQLPFADVCYECWERFSMRARIR